MKNLQDQVCGYMISTVSGAAGPFKYELKIFVVDTYKELYCDRFETETQARAAHYNTCKHVCDNSEFRDVLESRRKTG